METCNGWLFIETVIRRKVRWYRFKCPCGKKVKLFAEAAVERKFIPFPRCRACTQKRDTDYENWVQEHVEAFITATFNVQWEHWISVSKIKRAYKAFVGTGRRITATRLGAELQARGHFLNDYGKYRKGLVLR